MSSKNYAGFSMNTETFPDDTRCYVIASGRSRFFGAYGWVSSVCFLPRFNDPKSCIHFVS